MVCSNPDLSLGRCDIKKIRFGRNRQGSFWKKKESPVYHAKSNGACVSSSFPEQRPSYSLAADFLCFQACSAAADLTQGITLVCLIASWNQAHLWHNTFPGTVKWVVGRTASGSLIGIITCYNSHLIPECQREIIPCPWCKILSCVTSSYLLKLHLS